MAIVMVSVLLSACAQTRLVTHLIKKAVWIGEEEKSKGSYKIGTPYKVDNVWYYPEENFNLVESGIASWYGPGFHAENTANGETFDQRELTAAHRTLQLPSIVKITNLENGKSVVVRVNDRGPFKRGRIMDVSQRAAELLGFIEKGTARVRIRVLEKESKTLAKAAKRGEDTTKMSFSDIRRRSRDPSKINIRKEEFHITAPKFDKNEITPESMRTPTITVEALNKSSDPVSSISYKTPKARKLARGKIKKGVFVPDQIVSRGPVVPTKLYVQAGTFSVYSNAEKLARNMFHIAPTVIEPISRSNGVRLYKVKLGPIDTLAHADRVLTKVVEFGLPTAMVVRQKKIKR